MISIIVEMMPSANVELSTNVMIEASAIINTARNE